MDNNDIFGAGGRREGKQCRGEAEREDQESETFIRTRGGQEPGVQKGESGEMRILLEMI